MEIRIGTVDLQRLVPQHRLKAKLGLPVELHETRLPLGVDEPEGVDAEAFHEPQRPRDSPVGHGPHDHVHGLWAQGDEVPEVVVRRLGLREAAVRGRLGRMDQVGELDGVLDEEDRDVVAHQVPVAFLGVELHRKAPHVAGQVRRALGAGHGGEPHEHRRALPRLLEGIGPGQVCQGLGGLEIAVHPEAAGVDDPLGDPLVVEVEELLAQMEVVQQRRTTGADLQTVLVIGDRRALLGGENRGVARGGLMGLSPRARVAFPVDVVGHGVSPPLEPPLKRARPEKSSSKDGLQNRTRSDGPIRLCAKPRRNGLRQRFSPHPEPVRSAASAAQAEPASRRRHPCRSPDSAGSHGS